MGRVKYSHKDKKWSVRDRSSIAVCLALVLGASMNIACDNNKKKEQPKEAAGATSGDGKSGDKSVTETPPAGTSGGSSSDDKSRKVTGGSSNDLSAKLTSDERKSLNRFACKNKDSASKFAKFAQMVKDGDRETIDSISRDHDKEKVDALIKLAKAVGGSESKAKTTLRAICEESSDSEE